LSSFGFILTIFTGYKGNSGELVSERAKKNFIRIQSLTCAANEKHKPLNLF
jgi:hypothetical protein